MRRAARLLLAPLLLLPLASAAQEAVGVRVGNHPSYGRIVFDWPSPPSYQVEQRGDRVLLHFNADGPVDLSGARRPPRNVAGVAATGEGIEITLRPGTRLRHFRHGPKVVLDLLDPAQSGPAAEGSAGQPRTRPDRGLVAARASAPRPAPASPVPAPMVRSAPLAAAVPEPTARSVPPAPPAPTSAPAPVAAVPGPVVPPAVPRPGPGPAIPAVAAAPPAVLPPPAALRVRLLAMPGRPRAALVPFGPDTGLALLRRGDTILAVFDSAQPLDVSALRRDPVLSAMVATELPGGTQIALPLASPAVLRARRIDGAWVLEAAQPAVAGGAAGEDAANPVSVELTDDDRDRLLLRAVRPGKVVALTDPETGLPLLVGTVRDPGQPMIQPRRLPEADLLETLLGVAVLARADMITLRPGQDGFTLAAAGSARLALDPAAVEGAQAPAMTRLFDFPKLPMPQLLERLRSEQAAIAATAPLARLALRQAASRTLLALGLPQEAQAMLALALAEDPRAAEDAKLAALTGIAAVLAGRPAEASGLEHAGLPERDELILWHAALAAMRGQSEAAAAGFAVTLPLLLGYPEGLRARLLPLATEALIEAADRAALSRLVAGGGNDPDLVLARAALAEAEGRPEEALAGYDAVAQGRDRRVRARALRRGVELRLASGRMDAQQAARALEATLFAWRGDEHELSARRRIAELRRQAGDPRGALALLRETERLYPERAASLHPAAQDAFHAALEQESPLGAVALFDAYPEMLQGDARAEATIVLLAERLLALDLPDRAATLLRRAAEGATQPAKAALGLRLARLQLAEQDAVGARTALAETEGSPLPAPLAQERAVLAARAEARLGNRAQAIAALQALGAEGAEPLAELLAEAQDWSGAAAAFATHLRASLPKAPARLEEAHRRALLRQAALLALSGDGAALAALRAEYAPRMRGGMLAEPFDALTADPLRGLADLPRLQRELQLFRRLPARLEPLRAASLATR